MKCRKASKLEEDSYVKDEDRYHSDKKHFLKKCFSYRYLEGGRYDESVVGSSILPISFPAESMSQWRIKRKVGFHSHIEYVGKNAGFNFVSLY